MIKIGDLVRFKESSLQFRRVGIIIEIYNDDDYEFQVKLTDGQYPIYWKSCYRHVAILSLDERINAL